MKTRTIAGEEITWLNWMSDEMFNEWKQVIESSNRAHPINSRSYKGKDKSDSEARIEHG